MSKVLIFAGANGSGKTTLAHSVIDLSLEYIDADKIMDKEKLSYLNAGKKALLLIDENISKGATFSFETTMAGLGLKKRFEKLKNKKYHIVIFYLFAYPVRLLSERIEERIKKGGHFVAEKDVKRRYYRSALNFWSLYRFYANEWSIINNNEFQYKSIAIGNNGNFRIIDPVEFKKFSEVIEDAKKKR